MARRFYKLDMQVLNFDENKEVDEIRFNQYLMKKENYTRIRNRFEVGIFEITIRTVSTDLNIPFQKVQRLVNKFVKLGIIKAVSKSTSKKNPSIYCYSTFEIDTVDDIDISIEKPSNDGNSNNILDIIKSKSDTVSSTVGDTVGDTVKASKNTRLKGISDTVNDTVSDTVSDTSKKDNKKDITIYLSSDKKTKAKTYCQVEEKTRVDRLIDELQEYTGFNKFDVKKFINAGYGDLELIKYVYDNVIMSKPFNDHDTTPIKNMANYIVKSIKNEIKVNELNNIKFPFEK